MVTQGNRDPVMCCSCPTSSSGKSDVTLKMEDKPFPALYCGKVLFMLTDRQKLLYQQLVMLLLLVE